MGGFTANLGFCAIIVAELWGALYGLDLAWRAGRRNVILELDSMSAIQLIQKNVNRSHPHATVIARVKKLLARSWEVRLRHIYREANSLALLGHSCELGVTFYSSPPLGIDFVLRDDVGGVAHPRLIV